MGNRKPVGIRAVLGTALHASTAVFDRATIDHAPVRIDDAAGVLVAKIHTPEYETDYRGDDIDPQQAERIGLALHRMYCTDIAPTMHYTDVETVLTPFPMDCGVGLHIELTGSMDRGRVASLPHDPRPATPDLVSRGAVITNGR